MKYFLFAPKVNRSLRHHATVSPFDSEAARSDFSIDLKTSDFHKANGISDFLRDSNPATA